MKAPRKPYGLAASRYWLARNTHEMRRARGFSIRKLAAAARIRRSTIAEIERGDGNPTVDQLARLAAALKLTGVESLVHEPALAVATIGAGWANGSTTVMHWGGPVDVVGQWTEKRTMIVAKRRPIGFLRDTE